MKIDELFRQLSLGELSNLSISADGSGTIKPEQHQKIILYTQTALNALYGKFLLLEKTLMLTPLAGIGRYPLLARHSIYGRPDGEISDPYIIDTPEEPFSEDVIKVLSVMDQEGRQVFLNDEGAAFSLFTPAPQVIQFPREIPSWVKILSLSLTYQAKHPQLDPENLDQDFEIPSVLETALRYHIAGSVYSHMNGDSNTAKGLEFMTKYEKEVAEVIDRDLVSQTGSSSNHRFNRNGWV